MEQLNEFEKAVLEKLLAGEHPLLVALRSQAARAHLVSREYTGVGFYCTFSIPPEVGRLPAPSDFRIGDVDAKISGLSHGAGFVLFIRDGHLHLLEGYSYDEPWPEVIDRFELTYDREPRDPRLPTT